MATSTGEEAKSGERDGDVVGEVTPTKVGGLPDHKHISWKGKGHGHGHGEGEDAMPGAISGSSSSLSPEKKEFVDGTHGSKRDYWERILMGKGFTRIDGEGVGEQVFRPVDENITMPKKVRYITGVEGSDSDFDGERLSVYLDGELRVRSVSFGR